MPDYRSEKMESLEGEGNARGRRHGYLARAELGWIDLAQEGRDLYDRLPDELQYGELRGAIDLTELVGFWLAWHLGGGFAGLEHEGWNRSTIFRKVRRFRAVFGEHPDSYRFPWLRVDWDRGWDQMIGRLVALEVRQHRPQPEFDERVDDDEPVDTDDTEPLLSDDEG